MARQPTAGGPDVPRLRATRVRRTDPGQRRNADRGSGRPVRARARKYQWIGRAVEPQVPPQRRYGIHLGHFPGGVAVVDAAPREDPATVATRCRALAAV